MGDESVEIPAILTQKRRCGRGADRGSREFLIFKSEHDFACLYADGNGFGVREKLMVQEIKEIIAEQLPSNRQEG